MNPYQSLTTQLMAAAILILQREQVHKETASRDKWLDTYDYIVVGSGSAGTPVAYRLSEDPKVTVLLLEAGGRQSVVTDIPENYVTNLNSEYDWGYRNVKQKGIGLAFKNQQIPQNRGKVLGGSSTLNAIIFNRGNMRDYDNWAEKYGAKGWSFKEVIKYFKKYENNTDPKIAQNRDFHSTSGLVQIKTLKNPEKIMALHQEAVQRWWAGGYPEVDINGPNQVGTCIVQTFQRSNGMRSSTANSYLDPNPHKNLHILTKAFVTKILFSKGKGLNAEGVEFMRGEKMHRVKARKEVIISAGSINTPQLLMLSGIGPKKHLNDMKIPVKIDLPVGNNLQDHPSLNLITLIGDSNLVNPSPLLDINQLQQFFKNASGPLTEFFHSITYFSTKLNADKKWPDVAFETIVLRYPDNPDSNLFNEFEDDAAWDEYYSPFLDKYFMHFQVILELVKSRGTVRLVSNNPFDYPLIDPQFLADPQDYDALVEATLVMLEFLEKSPFTQYLVPLSKLRPIPGCQFCKIKPLHKCVTYIKCLIKELTRGGYHPVGTARMGAVQREDVVVDPRLRVKGVGRLRVCDASIMPEIINSNTNAASIMIGEKCADLIKQDNGYKGGGSGYDNYGDGSYEKSEIIPGGEKPVYGSEYGAGNKPRPPISAEKPIYEEKFEPGYPRDKSRVPVESSNGEKEFDVIKPGYDKKAEQPNKSGRVQNKNYQNRPVESNKRYPGY